MRSVWQLLIGVVVVLAGSPLRPLAAQVLTVGGVNPDYRDLEQAVAAAPPGAILSVRPGKYRGFTTAKPLRIRLEFGGAAGVIEPAPGAAYAIVLDGMPADGTFVLAGDDAQVTAGALGAIRVANTAGRVVLTGLAVSAGAAAAGIEVQNAGPVHLHASSLSGTPGLLAQNATVVANDLRVASPAGHAVAAVLATLDFARGSFAGHGLPALRVVDCGVRLAGDGATTIKVGGASPLPVPAIDARGTVLQWQPNRFLVVSANGAPGLVTSGGAVVAGDPPSLVVRGGPPGGTASIRCTSNLALPAMVVVAPFAPPVFLGLAGLYVDLTQPYAVPLLGVADSAGLFLSFTVPTAPALLGDVSCVQGAVFSPAGVPTPSGPVPLVTL
jgi:hypothetical protein